MSFSDELDALARKYDALEALRRRREAREALGHGRFDEPESLERRDVMRRVAGEWPGALRELEALPAVELARKRALVRAEHARAVADASLAAPARAWVAVVLDFHAAMRELLALKLWIARRGGSAGHEEAAAWRAARPASRGSWAFEAAPLERLTAPPRGRLLPIVWEALAARHGQPRPALVAAVFGPAPDDAAAPCIKP